MSFIIINVQDNVQLQDRFSSQHSHVKNLLLVPSVLAIYEEPLDLQYTLEGLKYWNADLPLSSSLENELRRWNALWMEKQATSESLPDNLLKALASCEQDSFPNIHSISVIACTLPISSAEAERSFSLLRRIRTYLRSTSEEHLCDLSIIVMHYGERVPVDEICQAFFKNIQEDYLTPHCFYYMLTSFIYVQCSIIP